MPHSVPGATRRSDAGEYLAFIDEEDLGVLVNFINLDPPLEIDELTNFDSEVIIGLTSNGIYQSALVFRDTISSLDTTDSGAADV